MAVPNCTNVTLHAKEHTTHKNTVGENFTLCPKWKFNPGELYFNPSDRSVTYSEANLSYTLGNYFTSSDNSTWVCVPESCVPPSFNIDAFFVFLWIISIIGLTLSILVHIPQTNRRHHLKPALCHMVCLIGKYVLLILFQTSSSYKYIWASYITYLNIFIYFGLYTWLNVMGYDAWRQFHSKRLFTRISTEGFVYRSLYAWGVPTLLTLGMVIPEWLGCCKQTQRVERVGIKGDLLHYVLILGGLSISLCANVVFFVLVVRNLRQIRRELSLVNDCARDIRFNIRMHIKMMVTMGVTFVCVIVALILGPSFEIYYSVLDAIVSLQGFFLFLIYGWTPVVKKVRLLCQTSSG